MGLNTKTYWLTDRQSQCDFDLVFGHKFRSEVQKREAEYDRMGKKKEKWLGSESACFREGSRATQSWVCELL
jgi:hypothetical protein